MLSNSKLSENKILSFLREKPITIVGNKLTKTENTKLWKFKLIHIAKLYPTIDNSWEEFEQLYRLLHTGCFSGKTSKVALILSADITDWLLSTPIEQCKKQIINFLTTIYMLNDKKVPLPADLSTEIQKEIHTLAASFYRYKLDAINFIHSFGDAQHAIHRCLQDEYANACMFYAESMPPIPLVACKPPPEYAIRGYIISENDDELQDFDSELQEKVQDAIQKGHLVTCQLTKPVVPTSTKYSRFLRKIARGIDAFGYVGYIYLIRYKKTQYYKFGWMKNARHRLANIVSKQYPHLTFTLMFGVYHKKSLKTIMQVLKHKHYKGKWFELVRTEIVKIHTAGWRAEHNIN